MHCIVGGVNSLAGIMFNTDVGGRVRVWDMEKEVYSRSLFFGGGDNIHITAITWYAFWSLMSVSPHESMQHYG